MRRLLGRFAFSFFILAGVIAWEGRTQFHRESYFAVAVCFFVMGLVALRARHRP